MAKKQTQQLKFRISPETKDCVKVFASAHDVSLNTAMEMMIQLAAKAIVDGYGIRAEYALVRPSRIVKEFSVGPSETKLLTQ